MMKYVILIIFLVLLFLTLFYLYGYIINKHLNKKKLQLGFNVQKNKYCNYFKILTLITTLFGGLFIFALVYKNPLDGVISSFKNNSEYENIINDSNNDVTIKKIDKAIELDNYAYFNQMIETDDEVIALTENELVKYDIASSETLRVDLNEDSSNNGILLYRDRIIAYANFDEKSKIQMFNKDTLLKVDEILINSKILNVSLHNDNLNVYTYGDGKERLQYEFLSSKKIDNLNYRELDYVVGCKHQNVFCHTRINLKNGNLKQYGLFVSDLYYTFSDEIILCTNVANKHSLPTSFVFKYDSELMRITNSKLLSGYIYYNPVLLDNLYINCNENEKNYIYKLNTKLELIEKIIDKDNVDLTNFYKMEDKLISFDDNVFTYYNLFSKEMKKIVMPYDIELLDIIDVNYKNQCFYVIARTTNDVISIKLDLVDMHISFDVHNDDDVFFTDEHIVSIGENGVYSIYKFEEIGN